MKKLIVSIFTFLFLSFTGNSQTLGLSEYSQISIITVGPGDNLVDCFGHSAIRVKDPVLQLDLVFNYGIYDFEEPNFILKFAQGKLLYKLGYSKFNPFFEYYKKQNRSIREQILDLSKPKRQAYFNYLLNNARPENSKYLYDFFYDNCATKLRDVTTDILKKDVQFDYSFTNDESETLRDLIHNYSYTQPWGTLGIDLALGSVIDRKAKSTEYAFLPDYIFEIFKESKLISEENQIPAVLNTNILFEHKSEINNKNIFSPLVVLSLISLLIIYLTYRDYKRNKRTKGLDFIIFFTTGLIGVLVLLLWLATDHSATAKNFNFLWAFPLNLFVAFILSNEKMKRFIRIYLFVLLCLILIVGILWLIKVQAFNVALIPILIMLIIRYFYLRKVI